MGEPKITAFFNHLLCIIRDEVTYKVFVSMLILIVEDLTCICTINDTVIQLRTAQTSHHCFYKYCFILTLLLSHPSQIKVLDGEDEYYKLLSTVESIPEEECTSSTTPPILSSGPFVSQSWTSAPMSAGKTDAQDMWTDTPKNILSVGCGACGASIAAAQNKQPAQVLSCDSKGDFSVIIYSSWGVDFSRWW